MNKQSNSLSQLRIIYIATTVFLVALSIYAFLQLKSLIDSSQWINHTNQVTLSLEKISTSVIEAETNQRSFLLIGDSSCLIKRDSAFTALTHELNAVDSLTKDNTQQNENLQTLHLAINEKMASMKKILGRKATIKMSPEFKKDIAEGIQKTKNVKSVINKMSINENYLLEQRTKKYSHFALTAPILIIVLFLGAVLILLVSYFRLNNAYNQSKKLENIAIENATRFNETLTSKNFLEESEQRYHQLIHSSPSAIGILYGEDLVITIANEPIIAIWGKGKEIIGKKYFEALPELAEQGYKEVFAKVYKTGMPFNAVETPVQIFQNGVTTLKYYNFVLYPQRNIKNEIVGIGIIATEVTSQALLNNTIKDSERQLRTMVEQSRQLQKISTQLIQQENANELYTQIMQAAVALMQSQSASLQMFNPETNELILLASHGLHPQSEKFWKTIPAESPNSFGDAMRTLKRVVVSDVDASEVFSGTEHLKHFHLSNIRSMQSTPLISREGKFVGILSTHWYQVYEPTEENLQLIDVLARQASDLMERKAAEEIIKESENRYRQLALSLEEKVNERTAELQEINEVLKSSEERYHRMVGEVQDYAIILMSKQGIIENWNKGAESIKGYKAEEIIGKSFSSFYTSEDRANHIPEKLLALATEKGKAMDENWRVRKDGSRFWGSVVITALRDDKSNIIGFVKVTRDLTEKRMLMIN